MLCKNTLAEPVNACWFLLFCKSEILVYLGFFSVYFVLLIYKFMTFYVYPVLHSRFDFLLINCVTISLVVERQTLVGPGFEP